MSTAGFDQAEYDRRFHSDFMYDATLSGDDEGGGTCSPLFHHPDGPRSSFGAVVWVALPARASARAIAARHRSSPPTPVRSAFRLRTRRHHRADQDKLIYERIAGAETKQPPKRAAGELAPPPETPVDLPPPPAAAMTAAAGRRTAREMPGAAEEGDAALAAIPRPPPRPPNRSPPRPRPGTEPPRLRRRNRQRSIPASPTPPPTNRPPRGLRGAGRRLQGDDAEAAANWQAMKKRNGDCWALKPTSSAWTSATRASGIACASVPSPPAPMRWRVRGAAHPRRLLHGRAALTPHSAAANAPMR